jgi:hypothetical protein
MQQQDHTNYIQRVVYQQHICWLRTSVSIYTHSITVASSSQTAHFHISVHRSPRQAPPPTQILCHPAATNCDASIYNSTTHLSIAEPSRLTIGSPRVASLQHIFSKLASKSEVMRFNLRGPHPQIHTYVDPPTRTASPARAPHQRHDSHEQTVQNKRPR